MTYMYTCPVYHYIFILTVTLQLMVSRLGGEGGGMKDDTHCV